LWSGRARRLSSDTGGFASESPLQAYLREAVVNRIRDLVRRSKTRGVSVVSDSVAAMGATALEAAIRKEEIATLLEALQQLRPSDRQLIVWRIKLGYSLDEIAGRTGKSKPATAMTVSRALARLKSHIEAARRKPVE
jgi:RNA polymerase sigma factor (sigma-70 family)